MPMAADDIIALIKQGIPGAEVEIQDLAGDGDHYAATVVSPAFAGKSKIQQHQMVYRRAGRPHGRRAACAEARPPWRKGPERPILKVNHSSRSFRR